MHKLASLVLIILHASYTLWALAVSYARRSCNPAPRPLEYPRRQIPKHLALLLVATDGSLNEEGEETCICRTVVDVVGWCKIVGIESLSVYNKQGVLYKYAQVIREMLKSPSRLDTGLQDAECHSDSDIEYPLTPPPSDHTISRPLSRNDYRGHPNPIISMSVEGYRPSGESVKRRLQSQQESFRLKLLSSDASKPLMAHVARMLAVNTVQGVDSKTSIIDIDTVNNAMQAHELDAPDYMIIHDTSQQNNASLELEGFPPWLVRLTEIHQTRQNHPKIVLPSFKSKRTIGAALTEVDFRRALDEFSLAEMRLGK